MDQTAGGPRSIGPHPIGIDVPARSNKSTLYSIQYLRAFAAAAVLGLHTGLTRSVLGGSGVDLFFVVSGFIMALVCRPDTAPLAFASSRFCRIFPLYWVVTLVAATLEGVGWRDTVVSLSLWPSSRPLVSQGWTLQIEIFFYLVVALAIALAPARMKMAASLALGLLTAANLALDPVWPVLRAYSHPIMLEFAIGLWLQWLWSRRLLPSRPQAALVIAGVLAYFALNYGMESPGELWRVVVWGLPHALLLWAALGLEAAGAMPHIPLLRLLGDASYSLYLVHQMVLVFLKPLLWHLPALAVVAIMLASSEILAIMTYMLLERPLLRIGHGITRRIAEWQRPTVPP